jgi:hypothetical protein
MDRKQKKALRRQKPVAKAAARRNPAAAPAGGPGIQLRHTQADYQRPACPPRWRPGGAWR